MTTIFPTRARIAAGTSGIQLGLIRIRPATCSTLFYFLLSLAFTLGSLVRECCALEFVITNYSFEIPAVPEDSFSQGAPFGWTGSGIVVVLNPSDGFFAGTTDAGPGPNPLDGRNAAGINNGGLLAYQAPNLVVETNVVYRLTLLAGQRSGVPFGNGPVSLYGGATLLNQGVPKTTSGTFVPFSISYTSPPAGPMIGRPLRIELTASGGDSQAWYDNVHLFADNLVCTPHKAHAVAQLFNGIFVGATILDPGCGYTNAPAVTIQGGGGMGATATAVILEGRVSEIRVTNGGCCYTNAPTIVFDSPPRVPTVEIRVSKVIVTQNVNAGVSYLLESSFDMITWTATGPAFIAASDTIESEFDVSVTGRFFRIRQLQ